MNDSSKWRSDAENDKPALTSIADSLRGGLFDRAAQEALAFVRSRPLSAQGWVCLGEALLRQGNGMAARAAFDRARLLDPRATWGEAVDAALAAAADGPPHAEVQRLLQVKRVTVAAAILAYNEGRCIERCIRSLLSAVDEIIVADQGSTDDTPAIAARFPQVKLLRHGGGPADDFAAARNRALPEVESDWVLWVDADEWLDEDDREAVRAAAGLLQGSPVPAVVNICQVNHIGGQSRQEYAVPRMFQPRRGLRYYGRVHEQVVAERAGLYGGGVARHSMRIRLHHDGYEPDVVRRKDKLARNLRLLRQMVEEEPDNPGWLLYYGRETLSAGDDEQALRILLQAEEKAAAVPRFGRLLDIHLLLIRIYLGREELDSAEAVCARALTVRPDFPDALFWQGQIGLRRAAGLLRQAERDLQQAKQAAHTYRGTVTADRQIAEWKADAALADLARLSGKPERAKEIYQAILKRRPELEQIRRRLAKLER